MTDETNRCGDYIIIIKYLTKLFVCYLYLSPPAWPRDMSKGEGGVSLIVIHTNLVIIKINHTGKMYYHYGSEVWASSKLVL